MLWLGERDAERPGRATDLSGHDENGAGFSPSYESWIAKRKPSSRNGSCENPWVLKKGADLEIWELVSLLLAARSGVSPSEDWLSSTLRANITQSSRWRPQSEWVGRRRLAALSVGKATLQRGRGEEQTSLLDSEGKESHHCLSLSFWSYITASLLVLRRVKNWQLLCKVYANYTNGLLCGVHLKQDRKRCQLVSLAFHTDSIEKTGSTRDRLCHIFSHKGQAFTDQAKREMQREMPRAGCSCLSLGLQTIAISSTPGTYHVLVFT